jgi:hypothetical protein
MICNWTDDPVLVERRGSVWLTSEEVIGRVAHEVLNQYRSREEIEAILVRDGSWFATRAAAARGYL